MYDFLNSTMFLCLEGFVIFMPFLSKICFCLFVEKHINDIYMLFQVTIDLLIFLKIFTNSKLLFNDSKQKL